MIDITIQNLQKQKRARSKRQIPAEEGLSVQETSQLITKLMEAVEVPPPRCLIRRGCSDQELGFAYPRM